MTSFADQKKTFFKQYSLGEEIANSITHGVAFALSVAGLTLLVTLAALQGDATRVLSFSIYGSTLALMYLASTLYHSLPHPAAKRVLKVLDHVAIYLLIAGTYTPFLLVKMEGAVRWGMFGLIWGLALAGMVFKFLSSNRFRKVTVLLYLGMGWLAVVGWPYIVEALPTSCIVWIALGGMAYTVGVIFYLWHSLPFNHAIWHLFVIAGSACHFIAMLWYVLPPA